jgi:hypothetical protein
MRGKDRSFVLRIVRVTESSNCSVYALREFGPPSGVSSPTEWSGL